MPGGRLLEKRNAVSATSLKEILLDGSFFDETMLSFISIFFRSLFQDMSGDQHRLVLELP